MSAFKIILFCLLFLILAWLLYADYISDREERFFISDFTANYFYLSKGSKNKSCYRFSRDTGASIPTPKILAIKFQLEYVSLKREHFGNRMVPGGEGPIDKIKSIEITDGNNLIFPDSCLTTASRYEYFTYKDTTINGHSGTPDGCLDAETFTNTKDFIYYYNYNDDYHGRKFRDVTLRNYHLFIINNSVIKDNASNLKLKLIMADGRTIIHTIR